MIKLFRNLPRRKAGIRKKLLAEDKTANPAFPKASAAKCLKYAIGEIVLVVIGILKTRPVRDNISVASCSKDSQRAFRHAILCT